MAILEFFKGKFTRKAFRRSAKFGVTLSAIQVKKKNLWIQPEYAGTATNISEKGLQVTTDAPCEKKDRVALRFSLHSGAKLIHTPAVVRNVRTNPEGKRVLGLEFVEL